MVYTLEGLVKEYENGKQYDFLFFWGHTPPTDGSVNQSCLSQWWMANFEVEGVLYSCAEQYMMAQKARLFGDSEMLVKILVARHPKDMKALGRMVQNFDQKVWDENCYRIVKEASKAKFSQNPVLLEFLLGTRRKIIVEASPRDRVWGIGMGKSNPDVIFPKNWRGKNLLGFALTEVREELLQERK